MHLHMYILSCVCVLFLDLRQAQLLELPTSPHVGPETCTASESTLPPWRPRQCFPDGALW